MIYHFVAFALGFVLDLLLGDPHSFPHPVRLIGSLIGHMEQAWNQNSLTNEKRLNNGRRLAALVLLATGITSAVILIGAYFLHPYAGLAVESVMTYQILAVRSLKAESMEVYNQLKEGNLPGARKAVSMIVGRDTETLNEEGVAKAAVETVAENTSDGVIAPMLALAIGGPILGFLYKAVNTMDSMIGYKNERFLLFGRAAARLDDWVNYIPARLSAYFMILASVILSFLPLHDSRGQKIYSGKRAVYIYQRDRKKHASPNAAHTEAVCAGSLGIQLAGAASYFGKMVQKPYIGDCNRPVTYEDIRYANTLMYVTAFLCEFSCLVVLTALFWIGQV